MLLVVGQNLSCCLTCYFGSLYFMEQLTHDNCQTWDEKKLYLWLLWDLCSTFNMAYSYCNTLRIQPFTAGDAGALLNVWICLFVKNFAKTAYFLYISSHVSFIMSLKQLSFNKTVADYLNSYSLLFVNK